MLRSRIESGAGLTTAIYDFEKAGDVLPMHVHDEDTNHVSVVARGAIEVRGDGWQQVLNPGDFVRWHPHDPHEFIALEDGARLINLWRSA